MQKMSGVFGYSREAVRVKVKKFEGAQPVEFRKFSVDPEITTFEVLQSILGKAFDIKDDFAICYRVFDVTGHETYIPLLTDWELDAAFLKAYNMSMASSSEPCLCLRVDLKPFEENAEDWELRQNVPIITQIRTSTCQEAKPSPIRLHGIFNQMGKTLNMVQRAFNFGEDGHSSLQPPRPPLSDSEFRTFLDPVGQIIYVKELRSVIYFGGIDPSLRKVVWKHLLNVYPDGMTGRERMDYIKKKAAEYVDLRETWKTAIAQGPVTGELAYTTGMVRKDVLRTDRHHPFYAGSDDNQNIAALFNILTTYALNHPKVSYCQGMSDLASPLLVTMNDEAHAYICFCALMHRLCTNFMIDGIAMTQKFTHLAEGLMYYDTEFYNYLKSHQADDLLFCYRWLLLEMKREFAFDDSLRMLEVLWSSLPADPPRDELKLFDLLFQPVQATPPVSPLVKTPRESAYTKVCALRRQSSSISLCNYNRKSASVVIKRQNHSLDETVIGKCRTSSVLQTKHKHQSLDDAALSATRHKIELPKSEARSRSISPLEQKSDSAVIVNRNKVNNKVINNKSSSLSSSMTNLIKCTKKSGHFKELKDRIAASLERLDSHKSIQEEMSEPNQGAKMVKNLNEFLNLCNSDDNPKIMLTKSSFDESESSTSVDTTKTRNLSSTSNDDTFDEYSPDDSQEYFPLTTSVTRELKLELENLDRKVFGDKFVDRLTCSGSSDSSTDNNKRKSGDIFLWENPLHHQSVVPVKTEQTPDEQCELEFDKNTNAMIPPHLPVNGATTMTNSCEEVTERAKSSTSSSSSCSILLPPPNEFGGGNPFLMFLCLTVLLQHREHIINLGMDYNEMAMHFDKMVRKHNVIRVLNQARQMYARYIKQHQRHDLNKHEEC